MALILYIFNEELQLEKKPTKVKKIIKPKYGRQIKVTFKLTQLSVES